MKKESKYFNKKEKILEIKGVKLKVNVGVFDPDPKITYSSSFILNNLPDVNGKEILDMGCGTGIIGVCCALNKAKNVLAVDIDEKAVENTKENISLNKVSNIEVIKSNLFEKVKGKFDYILANLPISNKHWDLGMSTQDMLDLFLSKAKPYLKEGGKIYFVWISDHDVGGVIKLLKDRELRYKEKIEEKLNRMWYLFEVLK